jgi:hypothetical protein
VATLVARNVNEAMRWGLAECPFGWSVRSRDRAFGRNLASVPVKMFLQIFYIINEFYKCCTLDAICKDNAAIHCITQFNTERFILAKADGI